MKKNKLTLFSKMILFLISILFLGCLFLPLWQIQLDAPQYPEGLVLKLYANKIGGDVSIINGLNHYIGMATLHTYNFFEFTILPYLFVFLALFSLLVVRINTRKSVLFLSLCYFMFILLSGIDFYRWNYEYGHNLDPNAAIKVPGMAYQPPLLGYKQLLNFGAYSIPDYGGWLLATCAILLIVILIKEFKIFNNN